ncbi:unnamed protein product [Caenorhabditis auriculariae]|uniref:FHA domain-containing protein n=1 Tax=Caenorhabditis auriculariae TaxID=2777116 RepID=A0A8S1H6G7_9PELO|nr:unnamed protein product [Caenorhabditis auriculariae]
MMIDGTKENIAEDAHQAKIENLEDVAAGAKTAKDGKPHVHLGSMWKTKQEPTSPSPERTRDSWSRENRRRRSDEDVKPEIDRGNKKYGLEERGNKWGKPNEEVEKKEEPVIEKEKVNMAVSGKLAEDTNTFRGVVIKYNEPPEAKKPIARQSAYLIGRDRKIADLPVDHPSCSKQHAVLQFRSMPFTRPDGSKARRIIPYIIDLGSGNGTFLNDDKIDPQRYVEIKEKDVLKFGFSTREFVVMKDKAEEAPAQETSDSPE